MVTPLYIEIALHYCSGAEFPRLDAPACMEAAKQMADADLLAYTAPHGRRMFMAGPALDAWVEALCNVPFPVQRWVIPPAEDVSFYIQNRPEPK